MTRTAKNAKGKLALALFSGLAVFGATTVLGAPKPSFSVAAAPATQTVTAGQTAGYGITINRQNKHTGPVALSLTGLPAYSTPTFSPATVTGSGTSSSLGVKTNMGGTTPAGTYTLTIRGASGGATSTTTATLVVVSQAQPNFALNGTPSQSVLSADDSTSHEVAITRSGGFTGPVALSVSGLPNQVSAAYDSNPVSGNSTDLTFTSGGNPKPGTYMVTVTGTGFAPGAITRSTPLTLVVEEKRPFQIAGDAVQDLAPGTSDPLDLALTNTHNFALQVTEIAVSVEHGTSNAGCDGADNFSVDPIPAAEYPLSLPANSTRTLSQLGLGPAEQPTLVMNDLPVNQDACKGATVYLDYSGAATK